MGKNNLKEKLEMEKGELLKSSLPIIETHCHLDYLKELSLNEILLKSKENLVEKIITISVHPDNIDKAFQLSQNYENVFCTQGVHPHEAKLFDSPSEEKIKKNSVSSKVVAIGEIGLDYHYDHSPREIQCAVFEKQLQMAIDLKKPVVIHTREAEEDTMAILNQFKNLLKFPVVIHSFTSSLDFAKYCLKENFYLGFNGIITFPGAENVRDVLRITPLDKILMETDAPFLTPVPFRGRENAPYYLPYIALKMAEIKEITPTDLLKKIYQNTLNVFNFS